MAPTLARINHNTSFKDSFNTSTLVRLLAELHPTERPRSPASLAERLGQWLDWADAISLSAALGGHSARPLHSPTDTPWAPTAAVTAFERLRAQLAQAVHHDPLFNPAPPRPRSGAAQPAEGLDDTPDFLPYRRSYQAHQRAMDSAIGPCRERLRSSLAQTSPALGRLAALDASLEQALAHRERSQLAAVPGLLEKHFKRLRPATAPALAAFGKDLQAVLLAELDIRLQPLLGLIEALAPETTRP